MWNDCAESKEKYYIVCIQRREVEASLFVLAIEMT